MSSRFAVALLAFISLALALPVMSRPPEQPTIEAKASNAFIAALAVREGLLVSACPVPAGGGTSGGPVIVPVGPSTACVSLGTTGFIKRFPPPRRGKNARPPETIFDATEAVKAFFTEHPVPGRLKPHLADIAGAVQGKFQDAFMWEPKALWPPTPDDPRAVLIRSVLFHRNSETGEFEIYTLKFHYTKAPKPMVGFTLETAPEEMFQRSQPVAFGADRKFTELVSGGAGSYEKINKDRLLRYFLIDPVTPPEASKSKGLPFLKRLAALSCAGDADESAAASDSLPGYQAALLSAGGLSFAEPPAPQ